MIATDTNNNPEIGLLTDIKGVMTNVHDQGTGFPVVLLHGSGPGVTAWANWRLSIQVLAKERRVIAPDLMGFGYTQGSTHNHYSMDLWVQHLIDTLDYLDIDQTDLIGNSFGGALALAIAIKYPNRIRRLVLMGSVGVPFTLTQGLDQVWGYQPSLESMKKMLDIFAFDRNLVTDELAELRYQASIREGVQRSYSAMFPAPRQRWIDAMTSEEQQIRALRHETLIIHGRDDQVIPLENSFTLNRLISRSQLHVFGECGHWTQIEHKERFNQLIATFLKEGDQLAYEK
ncbi:alpha/beta fold hydrolase [Neptuniibacter sp. 2_MG-2023]|uniref:alpha/beta fold hydrolase n=1 Tax=Neptuniibacter sp. 2_MG-2023 TaxID=3062671 RepID=UPI0026E11425|nr:alpha/beta hydrolase [Neptuniibacter sp. 2_MG-2023]MDO6513307.1 alpha/beta hydrolase [Neptuniibacter sp. 2_MG-2023]